jgi:tripeptide aminopeptidase
MGARESNLIFISSSPQTVRGARGEGDRDRPSGETPLSSFLVQTTAAEVKAFGLTPTYGIFSTDSNIPISLGIPAVTIGFGRGGRAHALDEWFDVDQKTNVQSAAVILAVVLAASGGRSSRTAA